MFTARETRDIASESTKRRAKRWRCRWRWAACVSYRLVLVYYEMKARASCGYLRSLVQLGRLLLRAITGNTKDLGLPENRRRRRCIVGGGAEEQHVDRDHHVYRQ